MWWLVDVLRDAAGRPLAGEWLDVWHYGLVRSDAPGRLVPDPAPPVPFFLARTAQPGQGQRWHEVREARPGAEIDVRL